MKKLLLVTTCVAALSANAGFGDKGFYISGTGGYSNVDVEDKATHKNDFLSRSKGGGFYSELEFGHEATFGRGFFSGGALISYDTSKAKTMKGTLPVVANVPDDPRVPHGPAHRPAGAYDKDWEKQEIKATYQPRLGLGLAATGGFYFTPTIQGYARLAVTHDFGKINVPKIMKPKRNNVLPYNNYTMNVWSITPGIGIKGQINECTSWKAGVDYKIAFKTSKIKNENVFKNKPKALIIKAGLTYHF